MRHADVVLTNVDAIGPCGERQLRRIVHNEGHARVVAYRTHQSSRVELFFGRRDLFAQLHDVDPTAQRRRKEHTQVVIIIA